MGTIHNVSGFYRQEEIWRKLNIPYVSEQYGSVKKIWINDGKDHKTFNSKTGKVVDRGRYRFIGSFGKIKGLHLVQMVRSDVQKRVNEGLYTIKSNGDENIKTIFMNPDFLRENEGKNGMAVDFNSCYFTTGYLTGAISKRVFDSGYFKNDMDLTADYKDARLIAIGSLGRNIRRTIFDGEQVKTKIVKPPLAGVRIDIIKSVWDMALEIFEEMQGKIGMFLTDCFYILEEDQSKLIECIEKRKYQYKMDRIIFSKFMQGGSNAFKVSWDRIDKKDKNKPDRGEHHFNKNNFVNLIK